MWTAIIAELKRPLGVSAAEAATHLHVYCSHAGQTVSVTAWAGDIAWPWIGAIVTFPSGPRSSLQVSSLEEFNGAGEAVTFVVCVGAMTNKDVSRLRDQLLGHLRHGPRHLLVDLSEVDLIEQVAVALLVTAHRKALAARCTFCLISPSQQVRRGLQLAGADRLLIVHPNLTSALAALETT